MVDPGMDTGTTKLREAVDLLLAVDRASLTDAEAAEHTLEIQRERDRLDLAFAQSAAECHRRGVGAVDGSPSTPAWLRRHTGMPEGRARAAIEDGQDAEALPRTTQAWANGEISGQAARTIFSARVEGFDEELRACEPDLIELAKQHAPRHLRRAVRHFRDLATAGADERELRERRGVYLSETIGGLTEMDGTLDPETGEVVRTAFDVFTDPPLPGDTRTPAQRRADGLRRICEVALASADSSASKMRSPQKVLYLVQHETLVGDQVGVSDGAFTGPIGREAMRRILCDADISRIVTGPKGVILDAGRTRRLASESQRRAVIARDQGCRYPKCGRPPGWCQVHHTRDWIEGGLTNIDQLVLLCPYHHVYVHENGLILVFEDNELQVFWPDGLTLAA